MDNPRTVGHVVSVNGFRVKVEILKEARSPSRATLDGVQTAVAINAYLTFSIGAGQTIIGIVTDLDARESYDPSSGEELSLELLKARRVVSVQLLGTVELGEKDEEGNKFWEFNPGITILPTLDTPAEVGTPEVMKAMLEAPPQRNEPDGHKKSDGEFDYPLAIGKLTGDKSKDVKASYNDLFSRSLAIVGNTGSGKSYSVASLLQKAMNDEELKAQIKTEPHVFILDINGEYDRAFGIGEVKKEPNHIYLNGKEFGIPLWFFNAQEICAWLSASEQAQEPILKDWWAVVKAHSKETIDDTINNDNKNLRYALTEIEGLLACLDEAKPIKKSCSIFLKNANDYLIGKNLDGFEILDGFIAPFKDQINAKDRKDAKPGDTILDWDSPTNKKDIRDAAEVLITSIKSKIVVLKEQELSATADSPLFIDTEDLINPSLVDRAVSQEDTGKISSYLTTLKLRLNTRLDDKRWRAFLNYKGSETKFCNLKDWMQCFGFNDSTAKKVSVIDFSMLSHEALPYACAVIGRILLEAREHLEAEQRYENPWVLVLEEAHNYARPKGQNEEKGQELSRTAFERIAKEGRKFGLSLIVASQRPSEISETIISQCANFISHRLQNPKDIEYFQKIIPMQAKRLLEQVTVLTSGEAIVFGSAFHIPTRVQIDSPKPTPWSQTAAPFYEWKAQGLGFPLDSVIEKWVGDTSAPAPAPAQEQEQEQDTQ